jgi:type VI secretion system protein ImpG
MIGAIEDVVAKPISAPINVDGRSVLCRGSEVIIVFDPLKLGGQSPYLFACVLETFMGLYCSINSFVRVIARLKGSDEELKRWPPRAGAHQLL